MEGVANPVNEPTLEEAVEVTSSYNIESERPLKSRGVDDEGRTWQ
jgi:hypothetical protein